MSWQTHQWDTASREPLGFAVGEGPPWLSVLVPTGFPGLVEVVVWGPMSIEWSARHTMTSAAINARSPRISMPRRNIDITRIFKADLKDSCSMPAIWAEFKTSE